jgi:hypothetical protein
MFLILFIVDAAPVYIQEVAKEDQIINIIDDYIVVHEGGIKRDLIFLIILGNIAKCFR